MDEISTLLRETARVILMDKAREDELLNGHSWRMFSQDDEDGIIDAILWKIPPVPKFFVEFGAGDGRWCNTSYLLVCGWSGVWFESGKKRYKAIEKIAAAYPSLRVKHSLVTVENVNDQLTRLNVPDDFGVLSIDVDGNDFWLWQAIDRKPAIVVIEYNGRFPADFQAVQKYVADSSRLSGSAWGASLCALSDLGEAKGYKLIATSLSGVNAFFVRDDLATNFKSRSVAVLWNPLRKWLIDEAGAVTPSDLQHLVGM